jgi:hypothetical protein
MELWGFAYPKTECSNDALGRPKAAVASAKEVGLGSNSTPAL